MARIKGLKDGKTNITVSYGGKSATFSNFTVNKATPITNLVVQETTYPTPAHVYFYSNVAGTV